MLVKDILLVEDNPADIKLTLKAFAKHNLADRVYAVEDGEKALKVIFELKPESESDSFKIKPKVILLDLNLPKIHGLEVLKEVKSNEKTRIIPVVVLTSSSEERDLYKSYQLGANSYIVKPIDYDKFVEAIKEIGIYWLFFNELPQ